MLKRGDPRNGMNKTSHRDTGDGFWSGLVNLMVLLIGGIYFRSRMDEVELETHLIIIKLNVLHILNVKLIDRRRRRFIEAR